MSQSMDSTNEQNIESIADEQKSFSANVTKLNALACNFAQQNNIGLPDAEKQTRDGLKVLGAQGGVQEMLSAQILSNHNLQQLCMAMANRMLADEKGQYFINSAIKLANSFTQQVALLSKLQGGAGQRIVVEHVEVHNGGQAAFIGKVSRGGPTGEVKK